MKSILVFIISIAFGTSGFCKSKLVQVESELKNATYIGYVVIQKYEDQKIWFNELKTTQLKSVIVTPYADNSDTEGFGYSDGFMTGYWPAIGDTILIVSDSTNRISMFAKVMEGNYRFWSPFETGSIAFFTFKIPFKHLKNEKDDNPESDYKSCSDGCLIDKNIFKELINGL